MNILGIDYGDGKCGIAMARGSLAEPFATVDSKSALAVVIDLAHKHQITEIVVGDCPKEFLIGLQSLMIPVHQADETLSSFDARQSLMHTTQKRRRENEHAVAAAIILQNWLDSRPQKV